MLSTIREKTQGWIGFVLLGSITVPFALWGISSYFSSSSRESVAKVDGTSISIATYRSALRSERAQYEQAFGQRINPTLFSSPVFKQAALRAVINRELLIRDAERSGYRVPNAQLGVIIRHLPQFRVKGHFDPARYQQVVHDLGYGVSQFESLMRANVLISQMRYGIAGSAFVTRSDVGRLLRLLAEKREITYAVFAPADFPVQVSPAEIKAYYQKHLADFTKPAEVRLDYVHLDAAALAPGIRVSEARLRRLYDRHREQFTMPEERRASHILIALPPHPTAAQKSAALKTIAVIERKLKAGVPFAVLARKYSQDPGSAAKGGDLGFIRQGALPPAFDHALFSMKLGTVAGPVRTPFGYHLIKLTAIKPGRTKSFAEARGELEQMAQQRLASRRIPRLADRLRRLVYLHSKSLVPAAQALHLTVKETGWVSPNGGGSGAATGPTVLKAAFSPDVLKLGHNSSVIHVGPRSYVAVRVAESRPPVVTPLTAVRARIVALLKVRLAQARAKKRADALVASLEQGKAAPAAGPVWHHPAPFTREDNAKLDPALVRAAFKAGWPGQKKPVYGETKLSSGAYAVFALRRVIAGKPSEAGVAARDEMGQILANYRGNDLYTGYLDNLRSRAKIKIYSKNL
ncbi:MAG: SurA N-terminal domain-containing protein [Acidiferrobacteraceae bacterium]